MNHQSIYSKQVDRYYLFPSISVRLPIPLFAQRTILVRIAFHLRKAVQTELLQRVLLFVSFITPQIII